MKVTITQRTRTIALRVLAIAAVLGGVLITPAIVDAQSPYSAGAYGACEYNSCGITFGAQSSISIDVTPSSGTPLCSVASAEVQVATPSTTGYTLSMTDTDTNTSLVSGGNSVPTKSGTSASPTAMTTNTWGYRVDSINGFGAGPTSVITNGSIPALTFAAIPASSATPDIIAATTGPADPYISTYVWYGLCANTSQPNGAYSDSVTYTVVVN